MDPAIKKKIEGKLEEIDYDNGIICYRFYCVSCKAMHTIVTKNDRVSNSHSYRGKIWKFNGDFQRPTFTPNIATYDNGVRCCVVRVHSGRLIYLAEHPISTFRNRMFTMQDLDK